MSEPLRILDLFCGLGGVARGFQKYLDERGIKYEYYAVDIDKLVLILHKKLNPKSIIVCRDALSYTIDELKQYDFIWASPECRYYSRTNYFLKRFINDITLWYVIDILNKCGVPYVVENVKIPRERLVVKPSVVIDRHMFWSNLSLQKCSYKRRQKRFDYMSLDDWLEYHEILGSIRKILYMLPYMKARKMLRNMLDSTLAYNLAKQVIPQVLYYKRHKRLPTMFTFF